MSDFATGQSVGLSIGLCLGMVIFSGDAGQQQDYIDNIDYAVRFPADFKEKAANNSLSEDYTRAALCVNLSHIVDTINNDLMQDGAKLVIPEDLKVPCPTLGL